ncbi:uncharacterized protein N0V89_003505 [Didymosphaeria variabile]|uniref:5'-Nucleotidase C-terminal domain-containing protein n=1 Tax=Didymosphaeria variabile TaxID=1932322 RepID=A0A9W8XN69_9PLEO|nr:uncharacterized protein N0V89_003505 [Didymosphaeria variabile]KAJ4355489.1 hypothetical protein N0V89_003505 [Didymosphaeria variabile]
MIEALNDVGVNFACLGNHELDFGVPHFQKLAEKCNFPWLCANVLDPALGEEVPLGRCSKTAIVEMNGIRIGLIGLVEQEWLATINVLPPNLIYRSASATARELVPLLRDQGADFIIALTHQREPNDVRLAQECGGLIDLILAGHDHFYRDSLVNGVRIVRSGTDFKNLSYIEARRGTPSAARGKIWEIDVVKEDITADVPEDPEMKAWVETVSSTLRAQLEQPVGTTVVDLDARFTTVRRMESNWGNFIADAMRQAYGADCCIISSGTIRGDQVYPAGVITMRDIRNCLPFEDPTVVVRVTGQAIWLALENSVSLYPALEGRFPQVSGITFDFDPSMPPFQRVKSACIGGLPMDLERTYLLASRDYMVRGKDGYTSLVSDDVEVVVGPEEGDRIYKIVLEAFSRLTALPFQAPLQHAAGDDARSRVSQKLTVNGAIAPTLEGRIAVI